MFSKKTIIIAITALILLLGGGMYWLTIAQASIGNLQLYKGKAQIIHNEKSENASTGMAISINDTVKTSSNSRVAIILKDGTIIRLKENSELRIAELTYNGEKLKNAQLQLISGQAWSRVKPLEKDSQFEVETPAATASVRGTIFNTTLENNDTGFYVDSHTVSVELKRQNKSQLVNNSKILWMNNSNLKKDFDKGQTELPQGFLQEEWITFNRGEDERICEEKNDIPECGEPRTAPSPTPTLTTTPTPTQSVKKILKTILPTNTPTPTSSPTPTPTQQQNTPTPTITPTPTSTPIPIVRKPVITNTPTPTPTYNPNLIR